MSKLEISESHLAGFRKLLGAIGAPIDSPDMEDTPRRFIKALHEMCDGYEKNVADCITLFDNEFGSELVILKDIPFVSLCAHHCLPFEGSASIAYVPGKQIVGLSKLARIVDIYAHRLQVQEQLSMQIAHAIMKHTAAKGSYVVIRAEHACMRCRGIKKQGAVMVTEYGLGELQHQTQRELRSHLLGEM